MNTQQTDTDLINLYNQAIAIANKNVAMANKDQQRVMTAYTTNDKVALKAFIKEKQKESQEEQPKEPKFNVFKETEYCIKALNAVRLQDKTLYVYDPNRGYTDDLEIIQGRVANLYHDKQVSIRDMDEVIKRMKRFAPSVNHPLYGDFIHFKNGILDVRTMEFKEGKPKDFILHMVPHNYNPDAPKVDLVDKTFKEWTKNDPVKVNLLLAWIAYNCLEGRPLHKFVVLKGPKRNGKTVICNLMCEIVGEYNASAVPMNRIGDRFKTGTFGKKMANIADENTGSDMPESDILKAVTGDGKVDLENKGQDSYLWKPITKLTFAFNEEFSVQDKSGALKARLIPIILDADFSDESKQDKDLSKNLIKEDAIEYLLRISIPLLSKVLNQGYFDLPEDSKDFLEEQDFRNNPMKAFYHFIESGNEVFLEDEDLPIMTDEEFWFKYNSDEIYFVYKDWVNEYSNFGKPLGKNKFFIQLKEDKQLSSYRSQDNKKRATYYRKKS